MDGQEIKELLREHRELLRRELREELELRHEHDVSHFQIPPELQRTSNDLKHLETIEYI